MRFHFIGKLKVSHYRENNEWRSFVAYLMQSDWLPISSNQYMITTPLAFTEKVHISSECALNAL